MQSNRELIIRPLEAIIVQGGPSQRADRIDDRDSCCAPCRQQSVGVLLIRHAAARPPANAPGVSVKAKTSASGFSQHPV